jgi:O-antigen ligase
VLLFAGIIGAFARGPWVGGAAIIVLFLLLGPSPVASLGKIAGAILLSLPVLLSTDAGMAIIDHLPWIGTVDSRNVDFRENLADVAIKVILQYPFFGNYDFATIPEIEALRGNDGIIDVVNTYIMIALKGGLVSLALFVGLILAAMGGVVASLMKLDKNDERHVLGRALLATIIGVLVTIATVSPIFFVYPIYWCLAGLMVGFTQLVARGEPVTARAGLAAVRPGNPPLRGVPGRAMWR